jgi:hypothetical protein
MQPPMGGSPVAAKRPREEGELTRQVLLTLQLLQQQQQQISQLQQQQLSHVVVPPLPQLPPVPPHVVPPLPMPMPMNTQARTWDFDPMTTDPQGFLTAAARAVKESAAAVTRRAICGAMTMPLKPGLELEPFYVAYWVDMGPQATLNFRTTFTSLFAPARVSEMGRIMVDALTATTIEWLRLATSHRPATVEQWRVGQGLLEGLFLQYMFTKCSDKTKLSKVAAYLQAHQLDLNFAEAEKLLSQR